MIRLLQPIKYMLRNGAKVGVLTTLGSVQLTICRLAVPQNPGCQVLIVLPIHQKTPELKQLTHCSDISSATAISVHAKKRREGGCIN